MRYLSLLVDDLAVEQLLGFGGYVQLLHHPDQLVSRLKLLYLAAQLANIPQLVIVDLLALLLDLLELLQIVQQVILYDLADLAILSRVVDKLLLILLNHLLQLGQLSLEVIRLSALLPIGVVDLHVFKVVLEVAGGMRVGLLRMAQIDRDLLFFIIQLKDLIQFGHLRYIYHLIRLALLHISHLFRLLLLVVNLLLLVVLFILLLPILVDRLLFEVRCLIIIDKLVYYLVSVVGLKVVCLVYLRYYLQLRRDLVLRRSVELVLDYAQQPLVEFQKGVDLGLVGASYLSQLLELLLAGSLQLFQLFILRSYLLHTQFIFQLIQQTQSFLKSKSKYFVDIFIPNDMMKLIVDLLLTKTWIYQVNTFRFQSRFLWKTRCHVKPTLKNHKKHLNSLILLQVHHIQSSTSISPHNFTNRSYIDYPFQKLSQNPLNSVIINKNKDVL